MAVLHYPINPKGYWTFDRHETLFEDKTQGRYQPSPSWNREHDFETLEHHWTFDDNQTQHHVWTWQRVSSPLSLFITNFA